MMKYITLLLIVSLFHTQHCIGQKNSKVYKVELHLLDKTIQKGYLFEASDSGIFIAPDIKNINKTGTNFISSVSIKFLSIRRRGKIGRTMLHGTLAGAATLGTFALIGNGGDDYIFSSEEVVGGALLAGSVIGALSGLIVGSFDNFKTDINGNHSLYLTILPRIQKLDMNKN